MFNYQKSDVYAAPSFWAQISTGLLLLIALIVVFSNFDNLQRQGPYGTLVLILLLLLLVIFD